MINVTVRKVGNSLGLILTQEAQAFLHVKEGDVLHLTESPEGYRITPYDPKFERGMAAAEDLMKRYRNALRELAK